RGSPTGAPPPAGPPRRPPPPPVSRAPPPPRPQSCSADIQRSGHDTLAASICPAERGQSSSSREAPVPSVRVAIIGVGNCASSLVQGVHYYRHTPESEFVPGLMHP